MNTIIAQLKKHTSITLLALAIMASIPLHAMEQPKDLIEAATDGDLERVKELIANGVDVNLQDDAGNTALMLAANHGYSEIVKTLLNAQADVNHQNKNGLTALTAAAGLGHLEVVKALINAQADVNPKNERGYSPLNMAARQGHLEVVKTLINAQADVNHQSSARRTALIFAAELGRLEIVKTLINAQANVNLQDKFGYTALMAAAEKGHLEIVKALLTDISNKDAEIIKNNFTGLLVLNRMQFMPKDVRRLITQKLIQELVDERMERANEIMGITNRNDLTARDLASINNHQEIAALLDPQNAESQKKLRAIIENKIRRILFGDPTQIKLIEKTTELDDPFGRWDEE